MAAVEFLTDLYHVHHQAVYAAFADADLYSSLLFFFEYHPYHNVLHQKVCEIFICGLDRNLDPVVNHFLYQTSLIRRIIESSREQGSAGALECVNGHKVNKGFLVFSRRIANKLVEMQKANEEIASFLDSIPEWAEYFENELRKVNEVESKPLGQDARTRKKSAEQNEDDVFVMNFLNRFNKQQEKEQKEREDEELQHSDSYERSGRTDPDEELLGGYDENLLDDAHEEANQVRDR